MMLTKEQIESLRARLLGAEPTLEGGLLLIALNMAFAWLEAQPRPIEEAPDHWVNERCIVWVDPCGVDTWSVTDGGYWKMANKRCAAKGEPPLYLAYLPLSALPTPAGRE